MRLFLAKKTSSLVHAALLTKKKSLMTEAIKTASILSLHGGERVTYVTDIEGDYEYWQRYIARSSVLKQSSSSGLILEDKVHFVYGGDVCDRGYGDIRILQDLVSLKERYPERVHFILGNRDINKLRLLFSLHPLLVQHVYANTYWTSRNEQSRKQAMEEVNAGDVVSKLKWILGKTMGAPIGFKCRLQELQMMQAIPNNHIHNEDDEKKVVNSYLETLDPVNGLLTRYLSYGKISLILGDTLFVHGAIHDYNMGWLPPYSSRQAEKKEETRVNCVREWTDSINSFARTEMESYRTSATNYLKTFPSHLKTSNERGLNSKGWLWEETGGYNHPQPGSGLVQYGMGATADRINPSVIYSTYLKNGKSMDISKTVVSWLAKAGVKRLIVGHQPNGDAPWVMRGKTVDEKDEVQVISVDNAYAKSVMWPLSHFQQQHPHYNQLKIKDNEVPHGCISISDFEKLHHLKPMTCSKTEPHHQISTRGNVVINEVILEALNGDDSTVFHAKGVLTNGFQYEYRIPSSRAEDDVNLIGRKTKDGWFVKAINVTDERDKTNTKYALLATSEEGFQFKNKFINMSEIKNLL